MEAALCGRAVWPPTTPTTTPTEANIGAALCGARWKPFESDIEDTYDILLEIPIEAAKVKELWTKFFHLLWAAIRFNQHMAWRRMIDNEEQANIVEGTIVDWSNPQRNCKADECKTHNIEILDETGYNLCAMFGPHMKRMGLLTLSCTVLDIKGLPPMISNDAESILLLSEEFSEVLQTEIASEQVDLHMSHLVNHEDKKYIPTGACTVYVQGAFNAHKLSEWRRNAKALRETGSVFQLEIRRGTTLLVEQRGQSAKAMAGRANSALGRHKGGGAQQVRVDERPQVLLQRQPTGHQGAQDEQQPVARAEQE